MTPGRWRGTYRLFGGLLIRLLTNTILVTIAVGWLETYRLLQSVDSLLGLCLVGVGSEHEQSTQIKRQRRQDAVEVHVTAGEVVPDNVIVDGNVLRLRASARLIRSGCLPWRGG